MKNNGSSSALGIDVGTSRICLAKRNEGQFDFDSQLNAFVNIPYSPITESVLKKEKISHTARNGEIVVHGNEADKLAELLGVEMRRTMSRGMLNPSEPESLSMIREMIASLVGEPQGKTRIAFTVPAAPLGAGDSLTYHEETLKQVLSGMGYEAQPVNEGLAVVYAELEAQNFTGIGVSCGAGLCNVCLAYLAVPVISFSIPQAGDYIDASAASVTGERANRIRLIKEEAFHFNGRFAEKTHQVLGVYHDVLIRSLVEGMAQAFETAGKAARLSRPLPIMLSGGTTMPAGFRDRFEKIVRDQPFPVQISDVLLAPEPLHSAAKGALTAVLTNP